MALPYRIAESRSPDHGRAVISRTRVLPATTEGGILIVDRTRVTVLAVNRLADVARCWFTVHRGAGVRDTAVNDLKDAAEVGVAEAVVHALRAHTFSGTVAQTSIWQTAVVKPSSPQTVAHAPPLFGSVWRSTSIASPCAVWARAAFRLPPMSLDRPLPVRWEIPTLLAGAPIALRAPVPAASPLATAPDGGNVGREDNPNSLMSMRIGLSSLFASVGSPSGEAVDPQLPRLVRQLWDDLVRHQRLPRWASPSSGHGKVPTCTPGLAGLAEAKRESSP